MIFQYVKLLRSHSCVIQYGRLHADKIATRPILFFLSHSVAHLKNMNEIQEWILFVSILLIALSYFIVVV